MLPKSVAKQGSGSRRVANVSTAGIKLLDQIADDLVGRRSEFWPAPQQLVHEAGRAPGTQEVRSCRGRGASVDAGVVERAGHICCRREQCRRPQHCDLATCHHSRECERRLQSLSRPGWRIPGSAGWRATALGRCRARSTRRSRIRPAGRAAGTAQRTSTDSSRSNGVA